MGMTREFRLGASAAVLLGACAVLSGCVGGPTYGTDKTSGEQLMDDLGNAVMLKPPNGGDKKIAYAPRGGLVLPKQNGQLVEPQKSLASVEDNPQWVENPEEMRDRPAREVLGADPGGAPPAVRVPRLDISASAGPGALVEAERRIGDLGVDPALMARLNVRPGDLSVIRASGDSMSPTIADGDELLVDRSDRRLGRAGRIFVIKIDGVLLVKRVSKPGLAVRVASDNPAYPPVEAAAVEVVGRVVWLSRALR